MEIKRIFLVLLLICAIGMPVYAASVAKQVDFMASGIEQDEAMLSGGLIYTYEAGTTTAKTCWTDRAKTTAETNPVVLDAQGRSTTFCDGVYKMVIKDSSGTTLVTMDGVSYGGEGLSTAKLSSYGSLSEAVADIGVTKTVLLIDTTDTLDANVTVPSNITLVALERDAITLNSKTLTVNGDIWAGAFEWIIGTGTFSGTPIVQFYDPTWTASTVTDSATPSYKSLTMAGTAITGAFSISGTGAVNTSGLVNATGGIKTNNVIFKTWIGNIGGWNMNSSVAGSETVTVVTGLTGSTLRGCRALIISDDGATKSELSYTDNVNEASGGCAMTNANGNAVLTSPTGSFYDSAGYNDATLERGWVIVDHIP